MRRFDPLLVFVLMGLVWMVAVPTAAEAATRGEHRYFTGNVQVSDCTFPLPTATNSLPPNPLLQVYGDEKWKFTVDRLHVVTDHSNRTATTNRTYAEIRFWNWTNGENVPLPWRPHLGGAVRRTFCVELPCGSFNGLFIRTEAPSTAWSWPRSWCTSRGS